MTVVCALLTAMVVARVGAGTMEATLAARVSRFEIVASKLVPFFILALIGFFLGVGIAVLAYGVPMNGTGWAPLGVAVTFLEGHSA